ncbi:squalene/phytoene synthase family protein [Hyphomicrobium sp.]|uniref:squalene/phytoene synthase family protein n=1 Tax=Hyphomicrobium sp. TaxID=82 RepID=UPI002E326BF1|nr:squalene/phytoene synthase family protein [Hyphomicrobium sp.]HEX2843554.1 squalene/phytoene synthase family protein [Hyphomicrobium sp.]
MDEATPVLEAARTHGRDRYLSALLAPADAQQDLVVLAAYLGELARIPLSTRQAEVGEIKFQWWRDALSSGATSGHPVADAVLALAERKSLSSDLVLAPIEGYSRELYEDGISDVPELSQYAQETDGAAIRLALAIAEDDGNNSAEPSIEPAGRALALTRLALTLPQHVAHGRLPLPVDFIEQAGDPRSLGPVEASAAARRLSELLADGAIQELATFRAGQQNLARGAFSAFLPLCLVEPYLKAVLKPKRDVLRDAADISPLSRVMRLWFAHWRGRV